MPFQVIVLNGCSSAGKTSIARALQALLPQPWLTFGVDSLIVAAPPALLDSPDGLVFAPDGSIAVGPAFRTLEAAWANGIAATAHAGAGVILDLVLLAGADGQARWRDSLHGLSALWVGVHCDPAVAAARETARGDRIAGMAAAQAGRVHRGVCYHLSVDTTTAAPIDCARRIAAAMDTGAA